MAQVSEAGLLEVITRRLKAVHVEITDMSGGCGQAYSTLIVSPEFNGLSSLKRHRIVNAALKDEIAAIHAWTAKCQTPEEWERHKADAAPPLDGTTQGRVEGTAG